MAQPSPINRIAFQGEFGANSDMACRDMYPDMEPYPCHTFEDAFNAVSEGAAELAMIPIENTLAGRVADIHHILPESSLYIVGEYFMPIHFQLMGKSGTRIQDIKTVCSHIHALGQCRRIIREHKWDSRVSSDTAGAAREVGEQDDHTVAAISPSLAAEFYNLQILKTNIEDAAENVTRFIILAREPVQVHSTDSGLPVITTFVFNVRNLPAALYKAMGGFATNGVNMTKLESYQLEGRFTATQFYADIEGHPDDPPVARALEELRFFSTKVHILGAYPSHPFRVSQTR